VAREEFVRDIDRFEAACAQHPLVVAAFLGGSYAAGTERDDSDIDVYAVTRREDYGAFVAGRSAFMESWGAVAWTEDVWNFEALGFDMKFRRMWEYYLAYCETGFRHDAIDVSIFRLTR